MNPETPQNAPGGLNPQTQQDQIDILKKDIESLKANFYLNNFLTSQDFNKYSRFNTALKVPHYSGVPTTGETGQIAEIGGKLYICSATNTWTIVGTQS